MSGVIDADTHIAESESIWKLMDEAMIPRRPVRLSVPTDTLYRDRNAFWLIDGNIFPKPAGRGSYNLMTPSLPGSCALPSRKTHSQPSWNRRKSVKALWGAPSQILRCATNSSAGAPGPATGNMNQSTAAANDSASLLTRDTEDLANRGLSFLLTRLLGLTDFTVCLHRSRITR